MVSGKIYLIIFLALAGFFLYNKFVYKDDINGCQITIKPYPFFSSWNAREAINILKITEPEEYINFCKYVKQLEVFPNCGGDQGGCYEFANKDKVIIDPDTPDLALAVSIIVHETCHAQQALNNASISEPECYARGFKVYNEIIQK